MALEIGVNSYVDLAYADSYFDDRFQSDDQYNWSDVSSSNRDKLLVTATSYIDNLLTYYGEKFDEDQQLEFPRADGTDAPVVPDKVKRAVCEMALYIYNNGLELMQLPSNVKIDKMSVTINGSHTSIPEFILSLLREFGDIADRNNRIIVAQLIR